MRPLVGPKGNMRLWERIKWVAALAGISWPFAAPFIVVVLLNLTYFCLVIVGAAVAEVFGWSVLTEALEGFGILLGFFDGFAIWFLIIWTVGYAVLQMADRLNRKN